MISRQKLLVMIATEAIDIPHAFALYEDVPDSWIGVDLDGTLAEYHGYKDGEIGDPVEAMLDRVLGWLEDGQDVRIMTARVADDPDGSMKKSIEDWCLKHIGQVLPVTNEKDSGMIELWDDRAVQVVKNTGEPASDSDQLS